MGAGATVSGLGATGDGDGLAALLSVEDPATPGAEMAAAMNEWFGARALVQNEQCAYPTGGGLVGEAHDFELYGPTDVNAQTSNGSLAVGVSVPSSLMPTASEPLLVWAFTSVGPYSSKSWASPTRPPPVG